MARTVSATEARVHFGELMRRVVEGQESVVVERGGKPQVVVISAAEYARLQAAQWERADRLLEQAHAAIRADLNGRPLPDMSELIRESREERDEQILDAVLGRQHPGPSGDGA